MSPKPELKAVVESLSKSLVSELASAELPLFDVMSRAFFEAPERARPRHQGEEENLGFGVGEVMLLTPVVLAPLLLM